MLRPCRRRPGEAEPDHRHRGGANSWKGGSNARAIIRLADGQEDRCGFLRSDLSARPRARRAGAKKWPHSLRTQLRCARSAFESADRRAHEFPAGVLHQAIHRPGHHVARARRKTTLRRDAHGTLSRFSSLRKFHHRSKPAESHFRLAGLRRFDGSARKSERPEMDVGKTNSGRRSLAIVEKRKSWKIYAGGQLVVQQFRLRGARTYRRACFRNIVRRISAHSDFWAAENESHHRLSKGKKRSRESRLRPHQRQ